MSTEAKQTTDHEQIKRWAEERGGHPATVKGTEREGEEAGILRIDFPNTGSENLGDVSWDEFFDKFEESKLAFIYQDRTADGGLSRFGKFVKRSA